MRFSILVITHFTRRMQHLSTCSWWNFVTEEHVLEILAIIQLCYYHLKVLKMRIYKTIVTYFVLMQIVASYFEGKTWLASVWKHRAQESEPHKNDLKGQIRTDLLHYEKMCRGHLVLLNWWSVGSYDVFVTWEWRRQGVYAEFWRGNVLETLKTDKEI
jgi:hypothetical protein